MEISEFLEYFEGVKQNGSYSNCWMALCPCHEDKHPSLSISVDPYTGKILLHDFAGCKTKDILDTVGLSWRDLFNDDGSSRRK